MIDTLSILLSHFLLAFVALRLFAHPYINDEPAQTERRHFKNPLPKKAARKRAGVETGEARPGSTRA